jgi:hypothetical protein
VPDFDWLERRLVPLGFRLVVCRRRPETFAAARERRLAVSGNPSQYDDLGRFVAEQERFGALAAASRLPRFELDVSEGESAEHADRVVDWLAATGGLAWPWGLEPGAAIPEA